MKHCFIFLVLLSSLWSEIIDIPTRHGVTERLLVLMPSSEPKAVVVLFAGGHGGLQLSDTGNFGWGEGNFLMRTRERFVDAGMMVVIPDAPSDRQREPYLNGFRQTKAHGEDIEHMVEWIKTKSNAPIWLVGTSRGTQSVAYVVVHHAPKIDGIVLTSSILYDLKSDAVPEMKLEKVTVPVLVVHHADDGCTHCPYALSDTLMSKLTATPKKELMRIEGGQSKGDPCNAWGYHGFNGVEDDVVKKITRWILP